MNQTNLKTLVPAVVGAGVLLYEAITHQSVSHSVEVDITNYVLTSGGFLITLWGIMKNHKKDVPKA